MRKPSFLLSRLDTKIAFGFTGVALLLLVSGIGAYFYLRQVESAFVEINQLLSDQNVNLEKVRSDYSRLSLELTSFLLLERTGTPVTSANINLIVELAQTAAADLARITGAFTQENHLETTGQQSLAIIDQIIDGLKKGTDYRQILDLKMQLQSTEGKFFSAIDQLLYESRQQITAAQTDAAAAVRTALLVILSLSAVSFVISVIIGIVIAAREKEADEFRDQLISIASHQLKTPITVISGNLQLLETTGSLTLEQTGIVHDLKESADNLRRVTSDLLDLSRIEQDRFKLEPKTIALDQLIGVVISQVKPLAAKLNVAIDYRDTHPDLTVTIDEQKLIQAIKNVLDNAVKYSPPKSQVIITINENPLDVTVSIQDSGIGIPKNEQGKIFAKFFRASNAQKESGTGLGLFIAKTIVEQSGGTISFTSAEKVGTTFFITLPLAKSTAPAIT